MSDMQVASDEAIQELAKMMHDDENFDNAMRKFGSFLRRWYIRAGYKQICRWLKELK